MSTTAKNLAIVVTLASGCALFGPWLAEGLFGPPSEPQALAAPPDEHPDAVIQGTRIAPSEAPIFETWEDEHFPFLGFAKELRSASEITAAGPTGKREHELGDLVMIPAGPFGMGDDAVPGSRPARTVDVPAFQIERYEVTSHQYRDFVRATGRKTPYVHENWAAIYNWYKDTYQAGMKEVPVVLVTWHDADAYCRWAKRRLPTEAEWEKAARGTDGRAYPWGNTWDSTRANVASRLSGPLHTVAEWDRFEASWTGSKKPEIFGVGTYPGDRSPYGVMDMAGNVSEWVAEPFAPPPGGDLNDRRGYDKALRVARGNSWGNRDYSTPVAIRYPYEATRVDSVIGFRCARDIAP